MNTESIVAGLLKEMDSRQLAKLAAKEIRSRSGQMGPKGATAKLNSAPANINDAANPTAWAAGQLLSLDIILKARVGTDIEKRLAVAEALVALYRAEKAQLVAPASIDEAGGK